MNSYFQYFGGFTQQQWGAPAVTRRSFTRHRVETKTWTKFTLYDKTTYGF